MSIQSIQFLLVPDTSAARKLRRLLVGRHVCSGILVGTWLELVEYACEAYLIPARNDNWNELLHDALDTIDGTFWSESFSVSPNETTDEVEAVLCQIVSSIDPFKYPDFPELDALPDRTKTHLGDILRLVRYLDGALPDHLLAIQDLLHASRADAIQQIYVYHIDGFPPLSQWQKSLVQRLNSDSMCSADVNLSELQHRSLKETWLSSDTSSLYGLHTELFLPCVEPHQLDDTVQWIGVRDYLHEVEVSVGMILSILKMHSDLNPCDIGLLIPDSFEYSLAIEDVYSRAGLALSGLPVDRWRRDLGREVVFHFLYCRQKPTPAMAMATCLSSPLMPWTQEQGAQLAQDVIDGDYSLRATSLFSANSKAMLSLLREGDDTPESLISALRSFAGLLDMNQDNTAPVHQAIAMVDRLCSVLQAASEVDWAALRQLTSPDMISAGESTNYNLEGITVWRENHEPWRNVRMLFVLGFAAGNYPTPARISPIFTNDELLTIRNVTGLDIDTPSDELLRNRERFKRQIGCASDFVTFLIPRRLPNGDRQAPSESLVFMQQLFNQSDDIILDLDSAEDRKNMLYLPQVKSCQPEAPSEMEIEDLNFSRNLLALRKDTKGTLRPESPSSLETLMVSPLAWLLRRLDAEPLGWAPESANVMLLGTLAHQVFEELFQPGLKLTDAGLIPDLVKQSLDDAIRLHGPFLMATQWRVERSHLATEITRAALAWHAMLKALNAKILGQEAWLQGRFSNIPIHGQADVILGLNNNRLLVVDYKKSSAGSRLPRMQKGYDSQASLYRAMLQTGGFRDEVDVGITNYLKRASQIGVVYYTLNDQTALTDTLLTESTGISGWQVVEDDISSNALQLIKRRIREVREGRVYLNRDGDAEFYDKTARIKPYALDNSPLISLFTMPDEEPEMV